MRVCAWRWPVLPAACAAALEALAGFALGADILAGDFLAAAFLGGLCFGLCSGMLTLGLP